MIFFFLNACSWSPQTLPDWHFQFTPCYEVGQLGEHHCGRGIRVAFRLDCEPLHGFEIGDGNPLYLVRV